MARSADPADESKKADAVLRQQTDCRPGTNYLHDICLCNRDSREVFYEHLGFIYIELINFTKGEQELAVDLDRWLHVLKNMSKMDKLPTYLRKPVFEKLFAIAAYTKLNKEERDMYNASLKNKWDAESIRQTAILEQKKARKQGLDEGREEGRKEGRKEGALAIALKLKSMDMAVEDIVQATGLSVEEIEELK
ncbi:Rpn family recombination-promoting nuclease/putative transposase [Sphingobacterium arenae]|uniref:Rpn family recombination-promoting nuclease/putative transposase n=1 Tax=Sphingobacterium arenae TaxID=1280598 RepID=A0ABR7Y632_9SPHI|nr:Rpn family recombination-promoting nuclease/putative transposase [Sphingobacterium arenae]MBD1426718.1 Rpn family recombination-promoting nuclease/putative transposase [Sphingobacterium arenae]